MIYIMISIYFVSVGLQVCDYNSHVIFDISFPKRINMRALCIENKGETRVSSDDGAMWEARAITCTFYTSQLY